MARLSEGLVPQSFRCARNWRSGSSPEQRSADAGKRHLQAAGRLAVEIPLDLPRPRDRSSLIFEAAERAVRGALADTLRRDPQPSWPLPNGAVSISTRDERRFPSEPADCRCRGEDVLRRILPCPNRTSSSADFSCGMGERSWAGAARKRRRGQIAGTCRAAMEAGESHEEALVREIEEEVGVVPSVLALIADYDLAKCERYRIFRVDTWSGGEPAGCPCHGYAGSDRRLPAGPPRSGALPRAVRCPRHPPRQSGGAGHGRPHPHERPLLARSCDHRDQSDPQHIAGTFCAALDATAPPGTAQAIAPDRFASPRPPPSHVTRQPTPTHENQRRF